MTETPFERFAGRRLVDLSLEEALELLNYIENEWKPERRAGRAGWRSDEGSTK